MFDKELVNEILSQIIIASNRIIRRSENIFSPDDFLISDDGIDKLDAICMMLITIGESLKKIDKITDGTLLNQYPEIDWTGAKGMRDIISHHYFDLNAEIVFPVCKNYIPELLNVVKRIKESL